MDIDTKRLTQAGLIGYIALVVASLVTGNPTLQLAADAAFGVTAILLGVVTLRIPVDSQLRYVAGGGFIIAGLAQFAEIVTGMQSVQLASTLFLLAGLFGYLSLRRQTDAMPF
ncbi:hypothetical protein E6P09_06750 [Haloferax mediterranei ATCC 33500]|uniref:Integral membrane protein n=1 Tax=Haloferax mediterranei (strain ATCC 33500 / DSM 1411 / JCM 8866 / NBRC 14739 / NCIMB 2177 / R-4) TaxID=523841 RepID=I3R2K7_HALMT|nr:hypothetical protein [Haloferax mediterranei]AFK18467.1 hypothetical protein HFX_0744 [Haloferax mediterranei ATCC 33500]AHZ22148.1 hypothetical protein BM92_05520 [Haloferax mediterranei ATCC 33500]EMA02259.1 hypothetical protein C439_06750 [Haloferax mediterranei ATCC 33500]MDX5988558.1 hypothetical protein [Haloferax mediterranei ATCC 33500]QCQ74971.1 hypothetical protein E6P09_06750 [Haloferax mediterranei ATCC 33500]